jgi:hypothetical protein
MTMPLTSEQEEQKLRKEVLRNDQLVRQQAAGHGTFFSHAIAASEEIGGRFAAVGKASVTGSGPIPHPHLPAPSWAGQDTMVEPAFGVEIDWVEPVGSEPEIEEAARILREREATATSSLAVDCADVVSAPAVTSLAVVEPIAASALNSKSLAITGAAVAIGGAGNSAAKSVSRLSFRRRL